MKKTKSSVVIILNSNKSKVLLQEYDDTYHIKDYIRKYNVIGGNLEENETFKECVLRELEEEILDKKLLNEINSRLISLGEYIVVYPFFNTTCFAHEGIFLSILDDEVFDWLHEHTNYCNEGHSRILPLSTDTIENCAWDTPFILKSFMNNNIDDSVIFRKIISFENPNDKILNNDQIFSLSKINKSIIYAPGCYDLTHAGHMAYLRNIKNDNPDRILVAGIGRDKIIKELKGNSRPFQNENIRAIQVANLSYVDYVVLNDEFLYDNEIDFCILSKILKPDFLAIPTDNKNQKINISFCKSNNIKPYFSKCIKIDNMSSSSLIGDIRK